MTDETNIAADGNQLKIVLDFQVESFIHAVLMLDDFKNEFAWDKLSTIDKKSYFQNVSLFVGNDAENSTKNNLCQGSPFLDIDDANNYFDDLDTRNLSNQRPWKYGDEAWCNLEGRYLHVVADLAH